MPDKYLDMVCDDLDYDGVFTRSKVNIYYFLRFVHLTNGDWMPKSGTSEAGTTSNTITNLRMS